MGCLVSAFPQVTIGQSPAVGSPFADPLSFCRPILVAVVAQ
jgi:hypothetical protein